jgi:hypothetical protein
MYSRNSYLHNLSQTVQRKLKILRLLARSNEKNLIERDEILRDKVQCSFCGSTKNITKEHVIPRWMFEKNTAKVFTTDIKELNQTYNKATIPACKICNSTLLSSLEIYVLQLFNTAYPNIYELSIDERENIIRWLEIIEYKFHIVNQHSKTKTTSALRRSFTRIAIKNKHKQINSLVLFKTTNEGLHFFHTMDEFIFIEFPNQQIALFYFYTKTFKTQLEAKNEAMKIIESVYIENNTKK